MSFSYDWTNGPTVAQVRLMVGDTSNTAPGPIFQDEEINGVLQANSSQGIIVGLSGFNPAVPVAQVYSFGRTAAMLLNGMGAVRARTLVKKVLDVDVDGASATAALQKLGQQYIDQETSAGYFAIAEMVQDPFSMRERLWKQLFRIQA